VAQKKKINGDGAVTQEDLALLGGQLTTQLNEFKHDVNSGFSKLNKRVDRVESGMKEILQVVKSIDVQLKEHKTLPARVARLERSVFR
jgi:hypothetical protein